MLGFQKWILILIVELTIGLFYPSVYLFWIEIATFSAFAYCLGFQVAADELIANASTPNGLRCDNCGQSPHLKEMGRYWLCDDCFKKAEDPHCPICGMLVEETLEARTTHMKDAHPSENLNTDETEGVN